ncbi:LaeA-like methyltransferase [Aspergillus heteromorphus CBS 117.55]|uniref:LaeA-like methyltransferase n=1 Tax=Aspergillus heteromorphus CBS 117.55 TaxID=1448321 RepID=A0A317WTN5_9EURO|nr:LaeA-like methyltransferase [Aspergillus heteromorphus CBS 117.55]PWY89171.1 LaeA-like methyltransferase [Aspergillus heteromorphus CBS 117.55]
MQEVQDKYVFPRDSKESERLNAQHNLLVKVTQNTLIHPSIPKEQLFSIADIATGTGIWLDDVSKCLAQTSPAQRYYHGFDISADQFPKTPGKIHFSVQDLTVPFAQEHWNRYDLVHVRLVIAALEEDEYQLAIANIHAILKPGGYIQWEELDEETYISETNPVIQEIHRCLAVGFEAEGKSSQASAKIFEESQAIGFLDVERICYSSDWNIDLRPDTEDRIAAIIGSLYQRLLFRTGQVLDEETAAEKAADLIDQHRRLCAQGIGVFYRHFKVSLCWA